MKNTLRISVVILIIILIQSCKKEVDNLIKDSDGNVYTSVTIGTQVWMVENLKTTKYRNGDLIGTTTPASLNIIDESTPKYHWAYDSNEINVATYGRLYTWYAVTDSRKVCPVGWHVPSDAEWTELTDYLGGEDVASGKLKETGTTHWSDPNEGATNETGFTALPGGFRFDNGSFDVIGGYGYWWSATESDAASGWYRLMNCGNAYVFRSNYLKVVGVSVRCIRN